MNKIKLIFCAILGNCFEVYDFLIYQLLSKQIAETFFNKSNQHAFIFTQLIFAISLVARPIGSLVFGFFADISGRKKSLEQAILLSGLATGCIGLLPSYEQVGIIATMLLVCCRFLQGFALGGEQGVSTAFLIEHSSPKNKGFLTSFCCVGQQLGCLLAIILVTSISFSTTFSEINSNLWRLVFIFSFSTGILGYWIRKKTNETIDYLIVPKSELNFNTIKMNTLHYLKNNKHMITSFTFLVFFGTFLSIAVFIVNSSWLKRNSTLPMCQYANYIFSMITIISIPFFWIFS